MKEFEKAAYSRLALNEGMKQIKAVRLTAPRKNCYYPIYSDLKAANNWLEDYAGNRHAFYCYQLARLARRAKRAMMENINSIFRDGEAGSLDIV